MMNNESKSVIRWYPTADTSECVFAYLSCPFGVHKQQIYDDYLNNSTIRRGYLAGNPQCLPPHPHLRSSHACFLHYFLLPSSKQQHLNRTPTQSIPKPSIIHHDPISQRRQPQPPQNCHGSITFPRSLPTRRIAQPSLLEYDGSHPISSSRSESRAPSRWYAQGKLPTDPSRWRPALSLGPFAHDGRRIARHGLPRSRLRSAIGSKQGRSDSQTAIHPTGMIVVK